MKMVSKNKNPTSNVFSFDEEELHWPEIKDDWADSDILNQNGMFKFSKIKNKLSLNTSDLTKVSRDAQKEGLSTYQLYGFGKPKGSQYIVKMSKFRKFYEEYMKKKNTPTNVNLKEVKKIPGDITNANDLINLTGFYYFKDICRFSPFRENEDVVKHSTKDQESQEYAKNHNGCWYDETKREFFINMELFIPWFFKSVWMRS